MAEVTKLLLAWSAGDHRALEELTPVVYRELRRLAGRYMAGERSNHTLQPSALVNEAYLKLVDLQKVQWQNRAHFFAVSAQLMRRILVDSVRRRRFQKRGGGALQVTLNEDVMASAGKPDDIGALDDALKSLEALYPRKARVVEMRFFAGLTQEDIAEALNVSSDTVMRDWKFAKVWLHREIKKNKRSEPYAQ
jgi:RNA polymerase sigma-70 factor (ECF subfamily)